MSVIKLNHSRGSKKANFLFTAEVLRWDKITIYASRREDVKNILETSDTVEAFRKIRKK